MPLYYVGDSTRVCWFKESGTYATVSGGAQWVGRVQEFTPTDDEGVIQQRYVGGGTRDVQDFILGPTNYTARLVYQPQDWELCVYAFGKVTESGTTRHQIDALNSTGTFPSFQIEEAKVGTASLTRTYAGCIVNTLTIEGREGEPITVSMDLIAQSCTSGTSATAVTSGTAVPYNFSDLKGIELSGTALAMTGFYDEVKTWRFTLNNNAQAPHYHQGTTRDIAKPIPCNREQELTFTVNMIEGTGAIIWRAASMGAGSEFNSDVWICRTGSADTSGKDYVKIWLSGARIMEAPHPAAFENPIEQTVTIRSKTAGMHGTDGHGAYTTFF